MIFRIICICLSLLFANCAVSPVKHNASPNVIPRAEILSHNENSVTIEHNTGGEDIAFLYAYDTCNSIGKKAAYQNTTQQYGSNFISTWKCIE